MKTTQKPDLESIKNQKIEYRTLSKIIGSTLSINSETMDRKIINPVGNEIKGKGIYGQGVESRTLGEIMDVIQRFDNPSDRKTGYSYIRDICSKKNLGKHVLNEWIKETEKNRPKTEISKESQFRCVVM